MANGIGMASGTGGPTSPGSGIIATSPRTLAQAADEGVAVGPGSGINTD